MDQGLAIEPPAAPPTDLVRRFERPTRVAHWLLAAPFLLLMLTGLTNLAPSLKSLQVADVRLFAWLHVVLGFATVAAVVLLVLPQLASRSARADLGELLTPRPSDTAWLRHTLGSLLGSRASGPQVGKFNAGQKLNGIASLAATAALLGTGVVLGINYATKEIFDVYLVQVVYRWHSVISLVSIPIVAGHLYLALFHPGTRESLRGITRGLVRRDWARRHHGAWLARIEAREAAERAREDG